MLLSEINRFSNSETILSKTLLQDNLRLFEISENEEMNRVIKTVILIRDLHIEKE